MDRRRMIILVKQRGVFYIVGTISAGFYAASISF